MIMLRFSGRTALTLCAAASFAFLPIAPVNLLMGQDLQAFAKGKSGSHGNSSGAHNKSEDHDSSRDRGKSGSRGNSGSHGNTGMRGNIDNTGNDARGSSRPNHAGSGGKSRRSTSRIGKSVEAPTPATRPHSHLNAELKRLNSLGRNINGLMRSSDPHMDAIRQFIRSSAESDRLVAEIAAAQTAADTTSNALDAYLAEAVLDSGLDPAAYDALSVRALQDQLDALNTSPPADSDPGYADWQAQTQNLQTTIDTITSDPAYTTLVGDVTRTMASLGTLSTQLGAAGDTSDQGLIDALNQALNSSGQVEEDRSLSPQMLEWARKVLGVGDYNGLIDAYAASLSGAGGTFPTPETDASDSNV